MAKPPTGHVFVSYSRRDDGILRRIVTFLRDQGIGVWLDNEKLIPGTPVWEEEIENAIAAASAVVVILSPDAKTSTWVRREISVADQHNKRIFPVLVRGDEGSSISLRLIGRQYVDLRKDEEAGLNSLGITLLSYLKEQDAKRGGGKKEEPFARGSTQTEGKEQDAAERGQKEKNDAKLQAALDEIDRKAAERMAGEKAERGKVNRPAPAQPARATPTNVKDPQPARKPGLSATVIVMSAVAAAICGCGGILLLPGLLNPVTPLPYEYPTEAYNTDFPTESPTEIPSVEPPPTDAPTFEIPSTGDEGVILYDTFDDNSNGWYMRSGETDFAIDSTEISDGVFIWDIQETKKGFVAYETYPNSQVLENFYVSVNVMLISGPPNDVCYGIAFRSTSASRYLFEICDQSFLVAYFNDSTWETLVDWTVSPVALNPDWNNISVYAFYDQFSFYINDEYVAELIDSRLPEGDISLAISVHDTTPGQIWFDDFYLTKE